MTPTTREKSLLWPAVTALAGLALLIGLGTWQLERKAWKEGLIAAIEARTHKDPVSLEDAMRRVGAGEDAEYVRVSARGTFLHDKERYFYAPDPVMGPGYHVYTPLKIANGGAILIVNRGYVPEDVKAPAKRQHGEPEGETEVVGLLRMPGKKGMFTPENDQAKNLWYWRDLDSLFRSAFPDGGPQLVPFFVDAEAPAEGGWPKGGATRLELPNRHLEYAITWYGLAVTLAVVFAVYAWPRLGRSNR